MARHRHAALGDGDRRRRDRRRAHGAATRRRDAVRRLHLLRAGITSSRSPRSSSSARARRSRSSCGSRPGGGFSGGPFHSQNPETSFAHIPGLKIVCPATPHDAKGLLATAIEDPNPVLFFEHKHLYRRIKGEVPGGSLHRSLRPRARPPAGRRRDHRDLGRDGAHRDRGGRGACEGGIRGRGARPPHAHPVGQGARPRGRRALLEGARPARGHAHSRLRCRDRGDDRRGGVRAPRRAGRAHRRPGYARAVLRRRSRRHTSRRSKTS